MGLKRDGEVPEEWKNPRKMAQKDTDARAISVKTFDLDCDFLEVRKQLDDIAHSCFGTE